jgi:hypothetical protein
MKGHGSRRTIARLLGAASVLVLGACGVPEGGGEVVGECEGGKCLAAKSAAMTLDRRASRRMPLRSAGNCTAPASAARGIHYLFRLKQGRVCYLSRSSPERKGSCRT